MKKRFFWRLSVRMTLYFSIVIVAIYVVLTLLISNLFANRLLVEMDDVFHRKVSTASTELGSAVRQIQILHAAILEDNTVRDGLAQFQRTGMDPSTLARVQSRLNNFSGSGSHIISIIAIENGGQVLHSYYSLPPYNRLLENDQDYKEFSTSSKAHQFTQPNSFPLSIGEDSSSITYLGRLYDPSEQYETTGTLAINLKTNFLFSSLDNLMQDSFVACFVTDENGHLIYQRTQNDFSSITPENIPENFHVYRVSVEDYPNWQLTCVVPQTVFGTALDELYQMVAFMLILSLIFVVALCFYIAKTITFPIKNLQSAMEEFGLGNEPKTLSMNTTDEMQNLLLGFNSMVDNIQSLTSEIVIKQEKEKEYEVALVQSQLDMLQMQINPHFIHNTLNTMKYMAQVKQNTELTQAITSLNALLRQSMSTSSTLASVEEEILNTENYLHLQRSRYDFEIRFVCEAPANTLFALLPKLILQPLVENSLFHGIAPNDGGTLTVNFSLKNELLYVKIHDDGVGIPQQKQQKLLEDLSKTTRDDQHIGLKNVNERLTLLYGKSSCLQLESQEGVGTCISFTIPFST